MFDRANNIQIISTLLKCEQLCENLHISSLIYHIYFLVNFFFCPGFVVRQHASPKSWSCNYIFQDVSADFSGDHLHKVQIHQLWLRKSGSLTVEFHLILSTTVRFYVKDERERIFYSNTLNSTWWRISESIKMSGFPSQISITGSQKADKGAKN